MVTPPPSRQGDLSCVNLREDLDIIAAWPPPQPLGLQWRLLERGTWRGVPFRHFEATFRRGHSWGGPVACACGQCCHGQ